MLAWYQTHLPVAIKAGRVAIWAWQVDSDKFAMDERGFELWGLPWAGEVTFEELSGCIHSVDRDRGNAPASSGSHETGARFNRRPLVTPTVSTAEQAFAQPPIRLDVPNAMSTSKIAPGSAMPSSSYPPRNVGRIYLKSLQSPSVGLDS